MDIVHFSPTILVDFVNQKQHNLLFTGKLRLKFVQSTYFLRIFMTYDEVISGIKNKTLKDSFIAIFYRSEENFFGFYIVNFPDENDPEYISISYEGGYLFSYTGEEDVFDLDDMPAEAKSFSYYDINQYPDIIGITSEYALFKLFQDDLPDPDGISPLEKELFVKSVNTCFFNNLDRFNLL